MRNERNYRNSGGDSHEDRGQGRNERDYKRGDRGYVPGAGYERGNDLHEQRITFSGSSPYTESDRNRDFGGAMMGRDRGQDYGNNSRGDSRNQRNQSDQYGNYNYRNAQESNRFGGADQGTGRYRPADYYPDALDLNRGHGSRDRAIRYGDEDPDQYDDALRGRFESRRTRTSNWGGYDRVPNQVYRSDYRNLGYSGRNDAQGTGYEQGSTGRLDQGEAYRSGRYDAQRRGDYNPRYDQGNLGGDRSRTNRQNNWNDRFEQQSRNRNRSGNGGGSGMQRYNNANEHYERDFKRQSGEYAENLRRNSNMGNDYQQGDAEKSNNFPRRNLGRGQGWGY